MTQYCSTCKAEVKDDYNFCLNCGAPVEHAAPTIRTCSACGALAADDQLFCIECGTKFAPQDQPAGASAPAKCAPRVCVVCGAAAAEEFLFCMECGSRLQPITPSAAAEPAYADESPATTFAPAEEEHVVAGGEEPLAAPGEPGEEPVIAEDLVTCVKEEPSPAAEVPAKDDSCSDDATTVLSNDVVLTLTRVSTGESYTLHLPETLGKGSAATCRIGGNSAISRRHAIIDSSFDAFGTNYYLEELGATNKTAVDGVDVARGQRCILSSGCRITLANEDFIFTVE